MAGMFLLVGPIFLHMGIQQASEESRYRSAGKTAEAVILDKSIKTATRNENSRTKYEISYRFIDAQGSARETIGEVAVEEWENLQKGSKIKVTYLPDSVNASRTEGSGDQASPVIAMAMGGLLTVIGGGILFREISRMLSERRLRRSGGSDQGGADRSHYESSASVGDSVPVQRPHGPSSSGEDGNVAGRPSARLE
jgi:hypothetical protein